MLWVGISAAALLAAGAFLVWPAPYSAPDFEALRGSLVAVEPPMASAEGAAAVNHPL